ncbi:hypothetical protein AOLI_G00133700 [Acnodon oligacanthus]
MILTDHHNVEYIKAAKRLNPRQASWALLFSRFNFTLTYWPGLKNTKADALSSIHEPGYAPVSDETIIPSSCIVAPIRWEIMEKIRQAHETEPPPTECLHDKLCVLCALRNTLMNCVHSTPSSGHPGIQRTLTLISPHLKDIPSSWWSSIDFPRVVNSSH